MKIGYALGGGAARGLAHIGVLKVLEEHGIHPDFIAGTSMGALVGALYAGGYTAGDIERLARSLDWRKMLLLTDIQPPSGGFIMGNRVMDLLKSILGDLSFSQLKIPYACVAVDIISGEEIVLREGSLLDSVHASFAIPGIFKPVLIKERFLVDGGLRNVVPVSVCREMGADYIIAVNVIPEPGNVICHSKRKYRFEACDLDEESEKSAGEKISRQVLSSKSRINNLEIAVINFLHSLRIGHDGEEHFKQPELKKTRRRTRPPTVWEILSQSLTITQSQLAIEDTRDANLVINPATEEIGVWQFYKATDAILIGETAARSVIPRSELVKSTVH